MLKIVVAAAASLFWTTMAAAEPDEDSIRHLLHSTFDKPDSRLVVDPVVVAGAHAIAGSSQGDMGGRALLRSRGGAWSLILGILQFEIAGPVVVEYAIAPVGGPDTTGHH